MESEQFTKHNWGYPPFNRRSFQHVQSLFPTVRLRRGTAAISPQPRDLRDLSQVTFLDIHGQESTIQQLLAESYTDAFLVMQNGVIQTEAYFNQMSADSFHLLNSVSKSFLGLLVGILSEEGLFQPYELISSYIPEFEDSAFSNTTLQHALDMSGAVKYHEDYADPRADFWVETAVVGWRPALVTKDSPDTLFNYALSLKETEQEDGASFHYRTVFTNVLSMVIERATGQNVETLLEEKIWQPLKPEQDAVIVADSVGMPYLGAGMNACARDLARFGQMIVQGGQLNDNQIISQAWIEDLVEGNDDVRRLFAASDYTTMRPGGHYHNQFWGSAQDNQTLMCLGIHGQYIHMNLANQTVIVKLSSQPESANNEMFPNAFLALDALSDQL